MGKFINLSEKKFNNLTVLKRMTNRKKQTMWLCKCDCGKEVVVSSANLKSGHTKSCGCYALKEKSKRMKEKNPTYKHGLSNSRLFEIWRAMKKRCYLKTHVHYKNYGARGIRVCEEWKNDFMNFYNWAMANGYRDDLTIDRINPDGNYEPNNCRWATYKEQNNNKKNNRYIEYNGEKHTASEWAEIKKINYDTFFSRLYSGWSIKDLIETPVRIRRRQYEHISRSRRKGEYFTSL